MKPLSDRELFEAHIRLTFHADTDRSSDGRYHYWEWEWAIWQARAAIDSRGEAMPVAWCCSSDPFNSTAFAWPGTDRKDCHDVPLYLDQPRPADAGKEVCDGCGSDHLQTKCFQCDNEWDTNQDTSELLHPAAKD